MKQLIVNADDFGRSTTINEGIIEGHEKGIVTSASLMTDRDAFDDAVALAKSHPRLGVGLHLDLDRFFNVQHGAGRLLGYKDSNLAMADIIRETERQLQKILSTGLRITHVDGHHHSHLRPELFAAVAALTAKHGIPVIRYFKGFFEGLYPGTNMEWVRDLVDRFKLRCTDTFFAGWEAVESSLPGYRYFDLDVPFNTAELMVHPGKSEAWRELELAHCKDSKWPAEFKQRGIELAHFGALV